MQSLQQFILESLQNEETGKPLTYDQALKIGKFSDAVKLHIMSNYVKMSYGYVGNILGRYGRAIPLSSWVKIKKVAKEHNDAELSKLIEAYDKEKAKYEKINESFENKILFKDFLKVWSDHENLKMQELLQHYLYVDGRPAGKEVILADFLQEFRFTEMTSIVASTSKEKALSPMGGSKYAVEFKLDYYSVIAYSDKNNFNKLLRK